MKKHLKLIKFFSILTLLGLVSSACLFGGAPLSPTQVMQTSVRGTLISLPTNIPTITKTPVGFRPTQVQPDTPTLPLPTITLVPSPTNTPGPVSLLPSNVVIEGLGCVPTLTQQDLAVVLSVIDGDTIQVIVNGKTELVSYIGVDAPQLVSGNKPGGQLAQDALQKNKSLVDGKVVVLVKDTSERDAAGHLLRYVLTDAYFVNNEMVKSGLAAAVAVPPDVACRTTFETTQQAAMSQRLGVWQATATSTARPNNLPSLTPTFKKSDH